MLMLVLVSGLNFRFDETKLHFITKRKTNLFVIRFVSFKVVTFGNVSFKFRFVK